MLLLLGIPGFLLAALVDLPWSGVAIAIWGAAAAWLIRRGRARPPEPGAFTIRACAVAPLVLSGLAWAWLTTDWPAALSALLFWGPPALLLVLAVSGGREHAYYGRKTASVLAPLAAFQIQLMIYGALQFIGHLFNGGSPI